MQHASTLAEIRPAQFQTHVPESKAIDLDSVCSIDRIRIHCKADDIPSVTDDQIVLYRDAAFEAAEQYSGLMLRAQKRLEESIRLPSNYSHDLRKRIKHTLQFATSDSLIYIYGPGVQHEMNVGVGVKRLILPNIFQSSDWQQCCARGAQQGLSLYKVMYLAGYRDASEIPSGIIVGVLKWIAWSIQNPGDSLLTVDDVKRTGTNGMTGTNNVAWGSGALELWRQYNRGAI